EGLTVARNAAYNRWDNKTCPWDEEKAKKVGATQWLTDEERKAIDAWDAFQEDLDDPDENDKAKEIRKAYTESLDKIREAAADTMTFFKENMTLAHGDDTINPENVVMMPSNTERDNMVTDDEADVDKVGGGKIGSQKRGSANATDSSYFVPLDVLASGWNGKLSDDREDCTATGYNFSDDPRDQFVMLASMTTMK
ncbi:MAG: hypothetical protein AAFV53_31020, partial [Myxococcota bacterium]